MRVNLSLDFGTHRLCSRHVVNQVKYRRERCYLPNCGLNGGLVYCVNWIGLRFSVLGRFGYRVKAVQMREAGQFGQLCAI